MTLHHIAALAGVVIELQAVPKAYGNVRTGRTVAVDDLTMAVGAGGVHGFLGPNGSGKTTTIRIKRPFDAIGFDGLVSLAGGVGVLIAAMLGATFGGADWGARTMGLPLSWEPRRTRVFLVRLGVLLVIALAVQAALVLLAFTLESVIAQAHLLEPPPPTLDRSTSLQRTAAGPRESPPGGSPWPGWLRPVPSP